MRWRRRDRPPSARVTWADVLWWPSRGTPPTVPWPEGDLSFCPDCRTSVEGGWQPCASHAGPTSPAPDANP